MPSGVYVITNKENDKIYIGSTTDFERRWKAHRGDLRKSVHYNSYLQHSWDKYGEKAFVFGVLEYLDTLEELRLAEQFWMDIYREEGRDLYNAALSVESPMLGRKHTKDARQKISKSKIGKTRKPFSDECRRNMSKSARDRPPVSEEDRRRRSEILMGHSVSREAGHKISEGIKAAWASGKYNGKETHCKGSGSPTGRKMSEETKCKIGNANAKFYPAFIHIETGEIIPEGVNQNNMCKKRGLNPGCMSAVRHGRQWSHRGWILIEESK